MQTFSYEEGEIKETTPKIANTIENEEKTLKDSLFVDSDSE